jgi:hypothetical protein
MPRCQWPWPWPWPRPSPLCIKNFSWPETNLSVTVTQTLGPWPMIFLVVYYNVKWHQRNYIWVTLYAFFGLLRQTLVSFSHEDVAKINTPWPWPWWSHDFADPSPDSYVAQVGSLFLRTRPAIAKLDLKPELLRRPTSCPGRQSLSHRVRTMASLSLLQSIIVVVWNKPSDNSL